MQEGIGRGGYRALALVFCAVGLVGLLVAAIADRPTGFGWVGLLLAAAGLVALPLLVRAVLGLGDPSRPFRASRAEPRGTPDEPVPLPTPEPPAEADPDADLGFEYSDPTPAAMSPAPTMAPMAAPPSPAVSVSSPWEADEPTFEAPMAVASRPRSMSLPPPAPKPASRTPPPPMARPRAHSAPPSGKSAAESSWPERKGKAGVTRRQVAERDLPRDPGPTIEVEGPGPARRDPPIVMAKTVASAEATGIPEGTGVGKCGNCGVLLLAPKKRPIRLQCPRCERVHLLA